MNKLTPKIAFPIILAGIFAILAFVGINYEQLSPSFYIIILLLIFFIFSFGLAVGERLSSPIKELLDRAEEVSKGNLSSRAYLKTKDEVSQLAEVFNKLAEELKASREQEVFAEKSVGIKVMAKTRDLEETITALEQKVKNRTVELERLIAESAKLQADAGSKEVEVAQLKSELESLKQKIGKNGKAQKTVEPEVVKNIPSEDSEKII